MKFNIKTEVLQDMVARSIKGASNNKLVPITSLLCVELKDNCLTLITTDGVNYLYVRKQDVTGEDFYAVVVADIFAKLISKLTCDIVFLSLEEDKYLQVSGNGRYSVELPTEDGKLIRFPDPAGTFSADTTFSIKRSTVETILTGMKSALAVTLENPCYTGYYLGDNIIATDTYKISSFEEKLTDSPMLLSSAMMDLLSVVVSDNIEVGVSGNDIMFGTPECIVVGPLMDDIQEYQVDAIMELVLESYPSSCKISKARILQILDRLSLFVTPYDRNGVYLKFTQDGIAISSKASTGVESIPFIESKNFVDFICCVDIEMLISQIKAVVSDVINLSYGLDTALKINDGRMTQVIALLDLNEE